MISFCKHFLHAMNSSTSSPNPTQNHSSSNAGLCLIASGGCEKATNVVESIAVAKTEKKSSSGFLDEITRTVSSSGFLDEIGSGAVDGLSSCTESLGFESSDQMEEMTVVEETKTRSTLGLSFRKASRESSRWRERVKNLPPPLSSLNRNGESNYFMKAVRENGRLVLTEVTIDRPEIFVASRQDGRLTLQLIKDEEEEDDVDESELESDIEEEEEEKVEEEEEEKEEERIEWRMPVTSGGGGGEGFRRCHELSTRNYQPHHHQHVPMWNHHQCVTTR